jgi:long-chain acyl-CoA synthetase
VKHVVYWGEASEEALSSLASVTITKFEDLMKKGEEAPKPAVPPEPEDLCTIMYTSGAPLGPFPLLSSSPLPLS